MLHLPDIISDEESEEFFKTISYNVKKSEMKKV